MIYGRFRAAVRELNLNYPKFAMILAIRAPEKGPHFFGLLLKKLSSIAILGICSI